MTKRILKLRNVVVGTICLAGILVFSGCDKEPDPNGNNNSTNYWEQSPLVWMQLNGKVKTITQNGEITTFDENGRIISVENEWNGKRNYVYNAGGQLTDNGTFTYTYSTHGKYVPKFFMHWNEPNIGGLVKNLKSVISKDGNGSNFSFSFDGNTLKMTMAPDTEEEYIIEVTYEGNYPKSTEDIHHIARAKYAANGMFTEYYEAHKNADESSENYGQVYYGNTYYYKHDGKFMLLDKTTTFMASWNGSPATTTTTFTYNDKKDIEKEIQTTPDGVHQTNYSYVYDSNNNWTKKTSHSDGSSNEEVRVITYY